MEWFFRPGLLGGLISGVPGIPVLNMLNPCFCLLVLVGAAASVSFT
jgi:hypothetical protein